MKYTTGNGERGQLGVSGAAILNGGGLTMETLITKVSSEERLEGNRGPVSIILFFKKQMEEAGKQPPPHSGWSPLKTGPGVAMTFFFFLKTFVPESSGRVKV